MSTGPHLHYEFRVNGVHRNPLSITMPPPEPLQRHRAGAVPHPDQRRAGADPQGREHHLRRRRRRPAGGQDGDGRQGRPRRRPARPRPDMTPRPVPPAGPARDGLFLGLISGTSADGIDAALVRFDDDRPQPRAANCCSAAPTRGTRAVRDALVALGQGGDARSIEELGTLDVQIAEAFADAALRLLDEAGVDAGAGARARFARPDRAPPPGRRALRRPPPVHAGSSATATSSPSAAASPPSPISAAATSPPAAMARRWCRRSMPRCCIRPTKTARCSTSAASPISPCCRRSATCAASTPARPTR